MFYLEFGKLALVFYVLTNYFANRMWYCWAVSMKAVERPKARGFQRPHAKAGGVQKRSSRLKDFKDRSNVGFAFLAGEERRRRRGTGACVRDIRG